MFSPLELLYIVLSFCALWLTAGIFWLLWQVATIFRNVNDTISDARDKMGKIETALTAMRGRFEHLTSLSAVLAEGITKVAEYALNRRVKSKVKKK